MLLNTFFKKAWIPALIAAAILCGTHGTWSEDLTVQTHIPEIKTSHAYPGHGPNQDLECFLKVYPNSAGSFVDDCRLCHPAGVQNARRLNECSYCHAVYPSGQYPLNDYGKEYLKLGRSAESVARLNSVDTDNDGFDNATEIKAGTFPGESTSHPDQKMMPAVRIGEGDLIGLHHRSMFVLMNGSKSGDYYADYFGYALSDVLRGAGLSHNMMTGITVFASDGYRFDYVNDEIWKPYQRAIFYGPKSLKLESETQCTGLIQYPESIPGDIEDGKKIPGKPVLLLADMRDGFNLDPFSATKKKGSRGEGPFRIIVPQRSPQPPDLSSKIKETTCAYPYNEKIHHNAGDSVRGIVAIQIHPSPSNTREPDWIKLADELLIGKEILFFGNVKPSQ